MVDNIITMPLGLVLIATAHMVVGPGQADDTRIPGTNATLQFTFMDTVIDKNSQITIYKANTSSSEKIVIDQSSKNKTAQGIFDIYRNTSVRYHISKLEPSHSGIYSAAMFLGSRFLGESNEVQLFVQMKNSITVSPPPTITRIAARGSSPVSAYRIATILVVSFMVLLAAVLPLVIWCVMRSRDEQQQQPQQNSTITVQETVDSPNNAPAPSLVYSILDFPKRPPPACDVDPNDTVYANVCSLAEKRQTKAIMLPGQ